jgi:hypothetical protein
MSGDFLHGCNYQITSFRKLFDISDHVENTDLGTIL